MTAQIESQSRFQDVPIVPCPACGRDQKDGGSQSRFQDVLIVPNEAIQKAKEVLRSQSRFQDGDIVPKCLQSPTRQMPAILCFNPVSRMCILPYFTECLLPKFPVVSIPFPGCSYCYSFVILWIEREYFRNEKSQSRFQDVDNFFQIDSMKYNKCRYLSPAFSDYTKN